MTSLSSKNIKPTIAALFFIIFIDQIGMTFIFPILTPLFFDPQLSSLAANLTAAHRGLFYGICLGLYPFFMFLSAPILGDLSDQIGRKKILLICLLGSAAGFGLSAIAITFHSISLLMISRVVAGFFSGSQFIAQAAIVDISPADKKIKNLSYIFIAISFGVIIGPMLGGYFSNSTTHHSFTFTTPFNIAIGLAIINAIFLVLVFRETYPVQHTFKIKFLKGFSLLKSAFAERKIRLLSCMLSSMSFGWSLYILSISWYLLQRFHFNSIKLGLFTSFLGIVFVITNTVILRWLNKNFKSITILISATFIMMIALYFSFGIPMEWGQWLAVIFISGPWVIIYTLTISLFSETVGADKQGWIMGITGSVASFAWGMSGVMVGPLGNINLRLPILIAAIAVFAGLIAAVAFRKIKSEKIRI